MVTVSPWTRVTGAGCPSTLTVVTARAGGQRVRASSRLPSSTPAPRPGQRLRASCRAITFVPPRARRSLPASCGRVRARRGGGPSPRRWVFAWLLPGEQPRRRDADHLADALVDRTRDVEVARGIDRHASRHRDLRVGCQTTI